MSRVLALLWVVVAAIPCWGARGVVDWQYDYVNVRAEPGIGADPVGRLTRGAEAEVLADKGEWVQIRYPGGQGWVVARSLRLEPEAASEPVTEPRAAPHRGVEPGAEPAPVEAPRTLGAPPPPNPGAAPAGPPEQRRNGYLSEYLDRPDPPVPDAGGGVLSLLSGLLIVLALLAAGVWLSRRLLGRRFSARDRGPGIRVLTTRPMGPKHALLLVEAGGAVWLVSQGPDGINPVGEIRDADALERLNESFGFRESPFEAQLRRQVDLESREIVRPGEPTPEDRLAALRRRPGSGEGS